MSNLLNYSEVTLHSYFGGNTAMLPIRLFRLLHFMQFNQSYPIQQAMTMVMMPQETLDEILDAIRRLADQPTAPKVDEWLTSEEARQVLGVSPKTWQNYRDRGVIPFSQTGRKIYVRRSDLDQYLMAHRIARRS